MPRNDSADSVRMAPPMFMVAYTDDGGHGVREDVAGDDADVGGTHGARRVDVVVLLDRQDRGTEHARDTRPAEDCRWAMNTFWMPLPMTAIMAMTTACRGTPGRCRPGA